MQIEGMLQDIVCREGTLQDIVCREGMLQDVENRKGTLQDVENREGMLQLLDMMLAACSVVLCCRRPRRIPCCSLQPQHVIATAVAAGCFEHIRGAPLQILDFFCSLYLFKGTIMVLKKNKCVSASQRRAQQYT